MATCSLFRESHYIVGSYGRVVQLPFIPVNA
jgi:hypothetical protein